MNINVPSANIWIGQPASVLRSAPPSGGDAPANPDREIALASFDTASDRDWSKLVRDVVALANSGGGTITIACPEDAMPSHPACPRTVDLAVSDVLQRLARYTDGSFADVRLRKIDRREGPAVELYIGPAAIPIGFTSTAGAADDAPPAFSAGTFYFRHGDTSAPGSTTDLRAAVDRRLRQVRKRWLRDIRRVMSTPQELAAKPPRETAKQVELQPVRIVTDPDAPALQPQDVDRLYPWRQKDLVHELNARLRGRVVNSYDIQAVRRQHRLDERPDFVFHLEGAGRRYSPAAAEWILSQYAADPEFFRRARDNDREMLKLRRRNPR